MKIAQIISTPPFAWTTGGPARVVFELSKSLVKRNHDVTVLTTNLFHGDTSMNSGKTPVSQEGIRFHFFTIVGGNLAWKYKTYFSPGLIWHLKKHGGEYDVLHLQDLISFQAIATLFYSRINKVPYVLTPHGCIPWLCEHKIINTFYYRFIGSQLLKNACGIIALTSTEKRELLNLSIPEEKIAIIPNGITLSDFDALPEKGRFRSKYRIGNTGKMILFLGRVHRIKGIDLLVDAFSDYLKKDPEVRLVIAGRDEGFLKVLQQQANRLDIADKIIFSGQLTEQEKFSAYVDADVFILPSIHEGFPMTVLEAMACGTPVIVTKGCNISDALENCGIVIDHDRTQLVQAIESILENSPLRQHFGVQGSEKIKNEFNWDNIAERVETVYNNCLNELHYESI